MASFNTETNPEKCHGGEELILFEHIRDSFTRLNLISLWLAMIHVHANRQSKGHSSLHGISELGSSQLPFQHSTVAQNVTRTMRAKRQGAESGQLANPWLCFDFAQTAIDRFDHPSGDLGG